MTNKGFTLIELLAVIVILAIIALIATPIILNIIDNTKEQSIKRSIDHYMSAATTAIARENLNNTTVGLNPAYCTIEDSDETIDCFNAADEPIKGDIKVEVDGEKPTSGTIYFANGKITQINLKMPDKNTYGLNSDGNVEKTVIIYRNSEDELGIGDDISTIAYETDISNIGTTAYLKHDVENSIVTASYACITYVENGTRKDVCVRGGLDDSDTFDKNKTIISDIDAYFRTLDFVNANETTNKNEYKGYCRVATKSAYCYSDHLDLSASSTGYVYAVDDGYGCDIDTDGLSYCY